MNNTNAIIQVMNNKIRGRHTLRKVVELISRIPGSSALMGMAEDGLPVLWDTNAGASNIIVWNKKAKQGLKILKVIAEYLFSYHKEVGMKAEQIEFVVLTCYPKDWGELNEYGFGTNEKTSCIGIIPFKSELAGVVISGLARWVNERHNSAKHPVIILIDGLETLKDMNEEFRNHFQYLLDMGRNRRVYVMGTASKNNFPHVQQWLSGFQAEIYGSDVDDEFEFMEDKKVILFYTPKTELI